MRDIFDSQGLRLDNAPHNDISDDTRGTLSAEAEAELDAIAAQGVAMVDRFYELAPNYYWRAIEMEHLTRHVLHDTKGADEWQVIVDTVRARIHAQIESEMNTHE